MLYGVTCENSYNTTSTTAMDNHLMYNIWFLFSCAYPFFVGIRIQNIFSTLLA